MSDNLETNRDERDGAGNTDSAPSAKKQQNQYIYWSFTYNGYILETIEIMLQVLKCECDWYVIQEETGESGNKHLQGTFKLKKRKRKTELIHIIHGPHYEVTQRATASVVYCSRIDKRTGCIWTHNFEIPYIPDTVFQPHGWQLQILDIISKPPHPREINWFWEPFGGVGKSEMCDWLEDYKQAQRCEGKASDVFYIIKKNPNRRNIFFFDITKENMEWFKYSTIEKIKNGRIISGKYDSDIVRFARPHVFVFANIPPDKSKMATKDRWNIQLITTEQDSLAETTSHNM